MRIDAEEFLLHEPRPYQCGHRGELVTAHVRLRQVAVDGTPIEIAKPWRLSRDQKSGVFGSYRAYDLGAAPGPHEVRITCEFAVQRTGYDQFKTNLDELPDVVARWQHEYHFPLEIADTDVIQRVPNESLRDEIRQSLVPSRLQEQMEFSSDTYRYGMMTNDGAVFVVNPPVDLGFRVFCRYKDVETEVDLFFAHAGEGTNSQLDKDPRALFPNASFVDFIFRADVEAAEYTVDIEEIWDGEIVIEDVPIREATEPEW